MDYKHALRFHITFEKEVKPRALANIAFHKKNIKNNKQKISDIPSRVGMPYDEEQFFYDHDKIEHCMEEIKFSQAGAKCWTYLHNKDYENAVKYYERFKLLCHARIEDDDITLRDGEEIYTNDIAYLKLCNSTKEELDAIELFIEVISNAKNVSVILKAGRKMNKRKNKNNKA